MNGWTSEELARIDLTEELRIASMRSDGSLRRPVIVWVVRVGDDVYVRAVKGPAGPWYRGTQTRNEGHIQVGDVSKDVTFVAVGNDLEAEIDAAYREKYRRYSASIVNSTVTPDARAATLKLVPRS
jgi:hypothetical protein